MTMTPEDKEGLLAQFNANLAATLASIRHFEVEARLRLPQDYVSFLQHANGGEGFVGNTYVILWKI